MVHIFRFEVIEWLTGVSWAYRFHTRSRFLVLHHHVLVYMLLLLCLRSENIASLTTVWSFDSGLGPGETKRPHRLHNFVFCGVTAFFTTAGDLCVYFWFGSFIDLLEIDSYSISQPQIPLSKVSCLLIALDCLMKLFQEFLLHAQVVVCYSQDCDSILEFLFDCKLILWAIFDLFIFIWQKID